MSTIRFAAKETGRFGFRDGLIEYAGGAVATPLFFPIVNVMTGPPGVLANGGIWKHIKRELFVRRRIPAVMSQIMHFIDYGVSPASLERWLSKSIPQRILEETGHLPLFFVDSGGYRLLYNTGIDLSRYGLQADVDDVVRLQSRFGGQIAATLDYPLPRHLLEMEAQERISKSVENCIRTASIIDDLAGEPFILQLAVHGRSREEASRTVVRTLTGLRKKRIDEIRFGIAIGSLVPLSNSPTEVVDIVRGVYEGLRSCDWVEPAKVPVHAFGVSSRMIPILAAMGVDSFDGTSYIQSAQSLKYLRPGKLTPQPFASLPELSCLCQHCDLLREGGLDAANEVLRGPSFGTVRFAGRDTNKSFVYALIALHNLDMTLGLVDRVKRATRSDDELERLFADVARDPRLRTALIRFSRYFEGTSDYLWKTGLARLDSRLRSVARAREIGGPTQAAVKRKSTRDVPIVSLALGPDDFDITQTNYRLPKREVLLLLPCSQRKPYSRSPTHRFIRKALEDGGIDDRIYSKVSISGNYGPVPEEFEEDSKVQSYDFFLSSTDLGRIELLAGRTRKFVDAHQGRFAAIVAYCTAKSYRMVLEKALDGVPNAYLLPAPLKARRASQFRKPENAEQLVRTILFLTQDSRRKKA